MRQMTFVLFVLLFWSTALAPQAQENKTPEQKPAAPEATIDTEKPKNEVEEMIAESRKRGDVILGVCIDDCGEGTNRITAGVVNGRVVALPKPAYPPLARAAHVAGTVTVQVLIDFDGKVIAAAVIDGHPLLRAVCLQAARDSVFTPTKLEGQPVKVTGVLQYNFFPSK
jgi:TonB family protein